MPALLRMKPQVSKWLVAPSPDLRSNHCAPTSPLPKRLAYLYSVTGLLQAIWK